MINSSLFEKVYSISIYRESYDDDPDIYDSFEDEYERVECSRCGAPLDRYDDYDSIRGDIYCPSCAESERLGDDDDDYEETDDDYSYPCPRCGTMYNIRYPNTYGIAKKRTWCPSCAEKIKAEE